MTAPDDEPAALWRRFHRERRDPELVFRTYYDDVYRYVRARVASHADAEDVTAQVFAEALPKLSRLSFRGRPVVAFLYTIAGRRIVDATRRARPVVALDAVPEPAAADAAPALAGDAILAALAALPEPQRLAVYLSCVRGYRPAEVAAALGRSEKAAKHLTARGLERVRGALTEAGLQP